MVQKSFYIENSLYADLTRLASIYRQPAARLMRDFIKAGVEKTKKEARKGTVPSTPVACLSLPISLKTAIQSSSLLPSF